MKQVLLLLALFISTTVFSQSYVCDSKGYQRLYESSAKELNLTKQTINLRSSSYLNVDNIQINGELVQGSPLSVSFLIDKEVHKKVSFDAIEESLHLRGRAYTTMAYKNNEGFVLTLVISNGSGFAELYLDHKEKGFQARVSGLTCRDVN